MGGGDNVYGSELLGNIQQISNIRQTAQQLHFSLMLLCLRNETTCYMLCTGTSTQSVLKSSQLYSRQGVAPLEPYGNRSMTDLICHHQIYVHLNGLISTQGFTLSFSLLEYYQLMNTQF